MCHSPCYFSVIAFMTSSSCLCGIATNFWYVTIFITWVEFSLWLLDIGKQSLLVPNRQKQAKVILVIPRMKLEMGVYLWQWYYDIIVYMFLLCFSLLHNYHLVILHSECIVIQNIQITEHVYTIYLRTLHIAYINSGFYGLFNYMPQIKFLQINSCKLWPYGCWNECLTTLVEYHLQSCAACKHWLGLLITVF